jgi:hypothetical protein
VVECTALEMRHRCKPIGGSNPSLSAISRYGHAELSGPIRQYDVFATYRRPMELYQFDLRVMAGGCRQTSVARQQWRVERLGQRDIGGVIGRQIVP